MSVFIQNPHPGDTSRTVLTHNNNSEYQAYFYWSFLHLKDMGMKKYRDRYNGFSDINNKSNSNVMHDKDAF